MPGERTVSIKAVQLDADQAPRDKRSKIKCLAVVFLVVALCLSAAIVTTVLVLTNNKSSQCPWCKPVKFPHEDDALDHASYVSADGRTLEQNVILRDADGGVELELQYKAKLLEDWDHIVPLDFDERVEAVRCADGVLTIEWESAALAQEKFETLPQHTLITGSAEWGCDRLELGEMLDVNSSVNNFGNNTIQHRLVDIVGVEGAALSLLVKPCSFTDLFEDLQIHLETRGRPVDDEADDAEADGDDALGASNATYLDFDNLRAMEDEYREITDDEQAKNWTGADDPDGEYSARRSLRLLSRVRGNARGLLRRASRSVSLPRLGRVANFVRQTLNGNLRLGSSGTRNLRSYSWSGSRRGNVDLSRSRASLNLGVLFNLDINNWRLRSTELAVRGATSVTAHASVGGSRRWSAEHTFTLADRVSLGAVTFLVGPVPFRIEGQLGLDAHIEAGASGGASFGAGITATSSMQLGIAFRNGRWSTLNNRHWRHQRITPSLSVQGTGDFAVSIMPKVQLTAHWIGGPTVAVVPYLSAHAAETLTLGSSTTSCEAQAGWGLDATVGARLDIQNPATGRSLGCPGCTRTMASATVFSLGTRPLFTCSPCNRCRNS